MISGSTGTVARLFGVPFAGEDVDWQGVSTDTRTLNGGELFFALNGPNFRGRDFVPVARENGAAAAVVDALVNDELSQIEVPDTRLALGQLAGHWRDGFDLTVIAVTGSNGKTTVKQMLAACLGERALTTRGNLNNEIGVPLMLLELAPEHEFAALELGANHAGEIAYLASLVRPQVAIVTNAGAAHLEGFGSIEGVATAKGELFAMLDAGCTAVINRDDEFFELWCELAAPATICTFGRTSDADCFARSIESSVTGTDFELCIHGQSYPVSLPLPGGHNVVNACAAVLAATAAGVDAAAAAASLGATEAAAGRLNVIRLDNGLWLIDDTYNANPLSMVAAARFAVGLGRPVCMLAGDMGELGPDSEAFHETLGQELRDVGVEKLYCVGALSRATATGFGHGAQWFETQERLARALRGALENTETVLVKGSRAARMEQLVGMLKRNFREVR